ncbi:unannotated protein [freshwater metagenome]|uniref:Unannotated protein n=1 Tax=freshwater metagenome TaxID=449393 RepID=A0A6J7UNZ6_9ZZZZ
MTARYRPRRRSAGSPTSTATKAPITPATTIEVSGSQPCSTVAQAPTEAPTPTKAICPSDTCPAQPVSTTTDRPIIAKITMTPALNWPFVPSSCGNPITVATTAMPTPRRLSRTSRNLEIANGIGRTSPSESQEDASSESERRDPRRCNSRETMMSPARIGDIK